MRSFQVHLKERFAFLGENGCDAVLEAYLPYNMTEMGRENQRRPAVLICPGGSYAMCSQREAEPIALQYLAAGFCSFVLDYSVAPEHFPQALLEALTAIRWARSPAGTSATPSPISVKRRIRAASHEGKEA